MSQQYILVVIVMLNEYGLTLLNQVNNERGYRLHMRSRHRMTQ